MSAGATMIDRALRVGPGRIARAAACVMLAAALIAIAAARPACADAPSRRHTVRPSPAGVTSRAAIAFVDSLERGTFRWFWDLHGIDSVLTPDREPTRSFSSVGAIGFA